MSRAIPLMGVHDHSDYHFECDRPVCMFGDAWLPLSHKARRWIRRADVKAARRRRRREARR